MASAGKRLEICNGALPVHNYLAAGAFGGGRNDRESVHYLRCLLRCGNTVRIFVGYFHGLGFDHIRNSYQVPVQVKQTPKALHVLLGQGEMSNRLSAGATSQETPTFRPGSVRGILNVCVLVVRTNL